MPHGFPLKRPFLLPVLLLVLLAGCSVGEFVGAYFNTYYNASRAFSEAEEELLAAQDPRAAERQYLAPYVVPAGAKTKFTSVIEKCSKLLQYHPESAFVDDALMMIGRSYYYQNENQSAERKFRELIDGQPESELVPEARLLLANTFYRAGNTDSALAAARAIVGAPEAAFEPSLRSRAALLLAAIDVDAKNFQTALEHYQTAAKYAESGKERFAALMRVADMQAQLNLPQQAGLTYSGAESEAGNYLEEYRARLGRAKMLALVGDHDEALSQLEDMLANSNNKEMYGEIEFEIGNTYRMMGDTLRAVDQYRYVDTTYARTEFSPRALYELGLLYEKQLHLYDSARVAYAKARSTAGQLTIAPQIAQRSDAMNRYAQLASDFAKNESLLVAILHPPDSLARADSLHGAADSTVADSLVADSLVADSLVAHTLVADTLAAVTDSTSAKEPPDTTAVNEEAVDSTRAAAGEVTDETRPAESIPSDRRLDGKETGESDAPPDSAAGKTAPPPVAVPLDTLHARLALGESELGALFYNALEVNDSAQYWFTRLLREYPASPYAPRALYTLAQIARHDSLPALADSLYRVLADEHPGTEFGSAARKFLGLPETADTTGEAEEDYRAAEERLEAGQAADALKQFRSITARHAASPVAARAEYAVGWIYEEVLAQPESALAHYRTVAEKYPGTPYAGAVKPRLDAMEQYERARAAEEQAAKDSIARLSEKVKKDSVGADSAASPPPQELAPSDTTAVSPQQEPAPPDTAVSPPGESPAIEETPPPGEEPTSADTSGVPVETIPGEPGVPPDTTGPGGQEPPP